MRARARERVARGTRARILPAFGLLLLAACAPLPAPSQPPPVPTAPGPDTPSTPPAQRPPRGQPTSPAVVDSGPTQDALAVLETIPDPLPPAQRVPPPERRPGTRGTSEVAPGAGDLGTDTTGADVPVPAPTRALGDRPPPGEGPASQPGSPPPPESSSPAGPTGSPMKNPSMEPPARPAVVPPPQVASGKDTCWRVQVAAPTERAKADQKREAAESRLLVPMVVEPEKHLFKVRTRNCLSREAADRLKERAKATGFTGAFRFAGPRP